MAAIKDSGNRTQFATGAVRDMSAGKGRMDLLPWLAIMRVSRHCEAGAIKYGERNVDKGIPQHSFIDSAFRHLAKYTEGMIDEDHLVAAAWNLLWALEQEEKCMETLLDLPWQKLTILRNLENGLKELEPEMWNMNCRCSLGGVDDGK